LKLNYKPSNPVVTCGLCGQKVGTLRGKLRPHFSGKAGCRNSNKTIREGTKPNEYSTLEKRKKL
jgi:hypothetical protein